MAVPLSAQVPSNSPLVSDPSCGWAMLKRSRKTSDVTPVSATFVSESSFAPSRSSDAGRLRLIR